MKFGKEFKKQKVPEWTDAYMDYNGLKRILGEILQYKQSKQPPTPLRARHQKLKLRRTFSGLHARSGNLVNGGDIEEQVIDVSTSPRDGSGSGHFYKTNFLRQSEQGGEIEVMFFRKLDQELNKVNNFYYDKVKAVLDEATELNKQMDALIALRIKVEGKPPPADNAASMPFRSSTSSIARIRRTEQPVEPGVEMICRSPLEELGDSRSGDAVLIHESENADTKFEVDMNDNCRGGCSSGDPEVGPVRTTNYSSDSQEKENLYKCKEDSLEILEHVKINNTLESPLSTLKGVFKDSKDDELRFKKEELKEAEDRLKAVFIEFYRKLLLLKHYSFMNLAAFSKIMKKYEKISFRRASRSYMKIVDNSYIGSCDEVNALLERVETTFINHFSNSNRRKGMKLLRPKAKREKHKVTFLSGFFSGCSIALIVAIVLRIEALNLMDKKEDSYFNVVYPADFIDNHLSLKQGTELGYREVFLLSTGSFCFLPVLQTVIILLFCPFNIIYRSSRFFFLKSLFRCVCAPLYKITLPDFLLADNLTSQVLHYNQTFDWAQQVQALRSIELYVCYYGLGEYSERQNKCHSHGIYNAFYFVIAVIPFWLRFLQCLRRLCEEKDAVQGYNGLKYFLIIIAVLIRTAFELKKGTNWLVFALISSAIATAMSTYWDIVVDWGLLRRRSKIPYLRDKLVISHKSVYFAAVVLNILLRVAWMQLVLEFKLHSLHRMTLTTVISCLEIIRRGIWNFFRYITTSDIRLENEHLNNVGKYRAFKSVPLPFCYYNEEEDKDD
ncbi:hypothetical protein Pint_23590 [Pistacia integerrima]|uniref:Uncharacterized protein n=1 Tax=Pistacia integerrima TaxID=434235 RepID=A0ACC0YKA1_9ROSI|nr:hypothetical protein Pint_23590 [Pistacia integerrima]